MHWVKISPVTDKPHFLWTLLCFMQKCGCVGLNDDGAHRSSSSPGGVLGVETRGPEPLPRSTLAWAFTAWLNMSEMSHGTSLTNVEFFCQLEANLQLWIMLLSRLLYWSFQSEMMRVFFQENQNSQRLFLLLSYHLLPCPNHKTMHLLASPSFCVSFPYLIIKWREARRWRRQKVELRFT